MARRTVTKMDDVIINEDETNAVAISSDDNIELNNVKKKNLKPLSDDDEIEVMSLISNVSYKDSKTGDIYTWDKANHIEPMTFDVLKNMWRNHKGYFKNMRLKPLDERVIEKFSLTKTFEKFEFLMDEKNYTKDNIQLICNTISETPNALKLSIIGKIKNMIVNGSLTNIGVIRTLERHFDLDLISLLD